MYEMTEEEEDIIVRYAAYVLAKHNVYQKDGMVAVNPELLEPETEETTETETPQEETETESGETEPTGADAAVAEDTSEQTVSSVSLADAAGYEGQLNITYNGFFTTDNFQEGKAYSLDAHTGYSFVVAQFTMENISGASIDVNVMETSPTFRMSYDGNTWIKEDVTLLLTDLSTYTGSLGIGESVDLVLLFEVPQEELESVGQLSFTVDKGGERFPISY
jgi:hypothetical protein